MGKGDTKRPVQITPEHEQIRWDFALGKITHEEFEKLYQELKEKNLLYRPGFGR